MFLVVSRRSRPVSNSSRAHPPSLFLFPKLPQPQAQVTSSVSHVKESHRKQDSLAQPMTMYDVW